MSKHTPGPWEKIQHTPGPWTAKAINEQTMKREFKKGDRVLVRNNDLQEWQLRTLDRAGGDRWYPFVDTDDTAWSQCRHIDDFRTGDKVESFNCYSGKWEDGEYVGRVNSKEHSVIMPDGRYQRYLTNEIRWHPSMPWAKKEPLTLEQRVEALERKLNEQ